MSLNELKLMNRKELLQSRKTDNGRIVKKIDRKLAKIKGEK
jgi:hypothetical protein